MFWMSIDAPHAGKWANTMHREFKKYNDVFTNMMVDTNTCMYGRSDWLVYASQYVDPLD
jgi:hypothetical protein